MSYKESKDNKELRKETYKDKMSTSKVVRIPIVNVKWLLYVFKFMSCCYFQFANLKGP